MRRVYNYCKDYLQQRNNKGDNKDGSMSVSKNDVKTVDYYRYNYLLVTVCLLLVYIIVQLPGNIKSSELNAEKHYVNNEFSSYKETSFEEYMAYKLKLDNNNKQVYYNLNKTLNAISNKNFLIQQDWLGENLYLNKDKSSIQFRCDRLFGKKLVHDIYNSTWPPPTWKKIDRKIQSLFTYNDDIKCLDKYENKKNYSNHLYSWPKDKIEYYGKVKNTCGDGNFSHCGVAFAKYSSLIKDKVGIIFSAQREFPWAEGALLALGAKHLTTVEYVPIKTNDARLTTLTMKEFLEKFQSGPWEHFDFAFSFTSLDQEGMGRFGENINPFSDLEMFARINCLLEPTNGVFLLGLPVGYDAIVFNGHRIYGNRRLSMLLKLNWIPIDLIGNSKNILDNSHVLDKSSWNNQPIWILKKKFDIASMNDKAINRK